MESKKNILRIYGKENRGRQQNGAEQSGTELHHMACEEYEGESRRQAMNS
jgi:hypothetical protein